MTRAFDRRIRKMFEDSNYEGMELTIRREHSWLSVTWSKNGHHYRKYYSILTLKQVRYIRTMIEKDTHWAWNQLTYSINITLQKE